MTIHTQFSDAWYKTYNTGGEGPKKYNFCVAYFADLPILFSNFLQNNLQLEKVAWKFDHGKTSLRRLWIIPLPFSHLVRGKHHVSIFFQFPGCCVKYRTPNKANIPSEEFRCGCKNLPEWLIAGRFWWKVERRRMFLLRWVDARDCNSFRSMVFPR